MAMIIIIRQANETIADMRFKGLFVGSGAALNTGGPVGVWLGYILMATIVYAMMVALGEMAALFPVSVSQFRKLPAGISVFFCACGRKAKR